MWTALLAALDDSPTPADIDGVAALMDRLTPLVRALPVAPRGPLPWGRYLVHEDPGGRYNLQLDVFSPAYAGQAHAHGTWGVFWILQGGLRVVDCELRGDALVVQRVAHLGPGGGQCFCPPTSDWHRVAAPAEGPQTLSLHLYGPGFDLDTGVLFGAQGPTTYRRGPLRDLRELAADLRA